MSCARLVYVHIHTTFTYGTLLKGHNAEIRAQEDNLADSAKSVAMQIPVSMFDESALHTLPSDKE